jgi:NADH oxidase (H2O2-forming)
MGKYDIVVIGGSAAGATAAITAKRFYPEKSLLLIRKTEKVPVPCGIPYVFGTVHENDKNLIPVKGIAEKNNFDEMTGEVTGIDKEKRNITLKNGEVYTYDKLVLALGSKPIKPPIPGVDFENVFTVQKDTEYLTKLMEKLDEIKNLSIIGCGFIGVEIAEECRKRNADMIINIVEMEKHCLQLVYDKEFCTIAESELVNQDINLYLDEKVEAIEGNGKAEKLVLKSGKELETDMIILGIGSVSNSDLAKDAGLKLNDRKEIAVNKYMQTSDENIFACGDCTGKISFFNNKHSGLKLASIATTEARIVGANLYKKRRINNGVIGAYSTSVRNIAYAAAGYTECQALNENLEIITGSAEAINRHPGCIPDAANLKVKLIFEAGTEILIGGQVMGAKSGGELINVISACIQKRMTADEIATFQTATHPLLTASPIAYQLVNAAEMAIKNSK